MGDLSCKTVKKTSTVNFFSLYAVLMMKTIKGRSSHLSVTEEEELVHWIKVTQCLYNKKLSGYKDKEEKDRLWKTKAASMGKTTETLAIRYRTLRTRYSRLLKAGKQIGDKLTERDQWVLTRMAFLKNHVHEVKSRSSTSRPVIPEDSSDQAEGEDLWNSNIEEVQQEENGMSSNEAVVAEDYLQPCFLDIGGQQPIPAPSDKPSGGNTERVAYAEWTKSVMCDLDPSLWRHFQLEHSQLLYRYLGMNDDIRSGGTLKQTKMEDGVQEPVVFMQDAL